MTIDQSVVAAFAPTGKLRASINLGNPILANWDESNQRAFGVSVDLANALGKRLGTPVELVVFDAAGKSVQAVTDDEADFGFFAIDPTRGETITFTAPYVLIEGFYMVRSGSSVVSNKDVDVATNHVVVGKGSAYDLFLTRELKHAEIVRAPTSPTVVATFLEKNLEVAAGVKQQLESDAEKTPGLRLLDERFMVIQQAMGTARSRGPVAAEYLATFVEEMKASGFIAEALQRHKIEGASVAPAAN